MADYRELQKVTRKAVLDSLVRSATEPCALEQRLARDLIPTRWERWRWRARRVRDAWLVLTGKRDL